MVLYRITARDCLLGIRKTTTAMNLLKFLFNKFFAFQIYNIYLIDILSRLIFVRIRNPRRWLLWYNIKKLSMNHLY